MRDLDDIKPQTPQASKIQCSTCIYRDKATINLRGRQRAIGVTRCYCAAFPKNEPPYGKPKNVLFDNMPCEYYKEDAS